MPSPWEYARDTNNFAETLQLQSPDSNFFGLTGSPFTSCLSEALRRGRQLGTAAYRSVSFHFVTKVGDSKPLEMNEGSSGAS